MSLLYCSVCLVEILSYQKCEVGNSQSVFVSILPEGPFWKLFQDFVSDNDQSKLGANRNKYIDQNYIQNAIENNLTYVF